MTDPMGAEFDDSLFWRAMIKPGETLTDPLLRQLTTHLGNDRKPVRWPGGNAVVFRLTGKVDSRREDVAVRCFRGLAPDLARRHRAISEVLDDMAAKTAFFVKSRFVENGLVFAGHTRPISWMDWVAGEQLDEWAEKAFADPKVIREVLDQLPALAEELLRWQIGHGDLQHGNLIVDQSMRLKVIDYDGMYVPALRSLDAIEFGLPDYQHPARRAAAAKAGFHSGIDHFSLVAIYLQLLAIKEAPDLWVRHHRGEHLLFREVDFRDPEGSVVLGDMRKETALRRPVEAFERICRGSIDHVPPLAQYLEDVGLGRQRIVPPPVVAAQAAAAPLTAPPPALFPDAASGRGTPSFGRSTPAAPLTIPHSAIRIEADPRRLQPLVGRGVVMQGLLESVRRSLSPTGDTVVILGLIRAYGKPAVRVDIERWADSEAAAMADLMNARLGSVVTVVGTVVNVARSVRIESTSASVRVDGPPGTLRAPDPTSGAPPGRPIATVRKVTSSSSPSPARLKRELVDQAVAAAMAAQWAEAVRVNQRILELGPDAGAHNRIAKACWELGDLAGARDHYRSALAIDPSNVVAGRNVSVVQKLLPASAKVDGQATALDGGHDRSATTVPPTTPATVRTGGTSRAGSQGSRAVRGKDGAGSRAPARPPAGKVPPGTVGSSSRQTVEATGHTAPSRPEYAGRTLDFTGLDALLGIRRDR